MPSPSKHSYTKSVSTSESYAGNRGKTALIHAIELLFFIKSSEFRKFHPSFITPTAMEFLDYIQSRYRKYMVIPSMRHRPLHTAPIPKPPILFKQFIGFIHAPAISSSFQSLVGCLYIVMEGLSLYGTIKSVLSNNIDIWRTEFCSPTFLDEFNAPLFWLLENKMPSCFGYRNEICTKLTQALAKQRDPILDLISSCAAPTHMLETLGQQYVHSFQTVFTDDIYKFQFVAPLSFLFGAHGVVCCKDFCETVIKKYSNLITA